MVIIRVGERGGREFGITTRYVMRTGDVACHAMQNSGGSTQYARSKGLSYAGKFIPVAPFPRGGGGEVYDVIPGAQQQQR